MNTPLTPKRAIELLDQAIEKRGLPASTGAHWSNALKAVLPMHPEFATMADVSTTDVDSFIRYYMMHTKDSHSVSKDRISRFRSALQFVKDYNDDPRKAVESRKVKVRSAFDKPKVTESAPPAQLAGSNGGPPLYILLQGGLILVLTGIPKAGLRPAERAQMDQWLSLIPVNVSPPEQVE